MKTANKMYLTLFYSINIIKHFTLIIQNTVKMVQEFEIKQLKMQ